MRQADRPEINDETPMPLTVAAKVAVARGVLFEASAKALRREADRGRLDVTELFGRQQTTLGDIKRMIARCRVPIKASPR